MTDPSGAEPQRPDLVSPDASGADPSATDQLFALVYDELKGLARHHLRQLGAATLCTTELVHEAFLKLSRGAGTGWEGRAHFFGTASRAMRQVLVDFARRRRAAKRGGHPGNTLLLGTADVALEIELDEILALDEALEHLDAVDRRLRQVVELRFFVGLSEDEIAEILGVSLRTVERDWVKARLFLVRELDLREAAREPRPHPESPT